MDAISLFVMSSFNRSFFEKTRFSFNALCLVLRRQCKSSVSKIRNAFGQFSATLQPNCSSIIKRSNNTIVGFTSFINTSKEGWFNSIAASATPIDFKSIAFSPLIAVVAKTTFHCCCKNCEINCNILEPAAEELGSTQMAPIISTVFFDN